MPSLSCHRLIIILLSISYLYPYQSLSTLYRLITGLCLSNIVNIANACINLSDQLSHFKISTLIIIPKSNKVLYNSLKIFCSIILLNTLRKLIEKVIRERLQYHSIASNFVHSNQLDELKQYSTIDTDIVLTHLIHSEQVKGFQTSTLAFDIIQFFSLLNHQLLSLIMDKAGFDFRISLFFSNHLIDRKTQYIQNNFIFPFFSIDVGVEQELALSLILSTLYIALIFHIFEKRSKNLFYNFSISFLSFVNDGPFILQEKSFEKSNAFLFCSYNIILSLFDQFGLYGKSEVFHFSRSTNNFSPLLWIYLPQEDLFYDQGISGNTLDSFSTGNFPFDNIFTFTPTRPFQ